MTNVSMLAMIGGSSGKGIDERPKLMVVSRTEAKAPITSSNNETIRLL